MRQPEDMLSAAHVARVALRRIPFAVLVVVFVVVLACLFMLAYRYEQTRRGMGGVFLISLAVSAGILGLLVQTLPVMVAQLFSQELGSALLDGLRMVLLYPLVESFAVVDPLRAVALPLVYLVAASALSYDQDRPVNLGHT